MVERIGLRGFSAERPVALDFSGIVKKNLPSIFGEDVEALTRQKIASLGIAEEISFSEQPIRHQYGQEVSPAFYFVERVVRCDAVLVSLLPPHSKTHPHQHSKEYKILEDYYPIAGRSTLDVNGEPHELDAFSGRPITVPLDTFHQLKTDGGFALTLIIMRNAGLVERQNWHT